VKLSNSVPWYGPMLKRVEIKNFRSCQDVVLDDLGPMTVLVGRNAVGKTNILQAIQWAADTATATTPASTSGNAGRILLAVSAQDVFYRYVLSLGVDLAASESGPKDSRGLLETLEYEDSSGGRHCVFHRENETVDFPELGTSVSIGPLTPCMPAVVSLMPVNSSEVGFIRPLMSALARVRYYPLDDNQGDADSLSLVDDTEYTEWLTRIRGTGNPGTSVLLRLLHLFQTSDPRFAELREILGANGLAVVNDIFVHVFDVPKSADQRADIARLHVLNFQPGQQSQSFPFSSLSEGSRRVISLLVSLIFDQSSVMLVEHPEDSIHRGLLIKLLDVLRAYSDQSQLILSSHSSVVFNTLDPRAIRLVTMEDGTTKVRPLTGEELLAAGRFMEEDGSLSDFIETVEED
jgi:predicted ATPase